MVSIKIKGEQNVSASHPRHEMLQVAEVVAREKGIEKEEVLIAMEYAMQKTAKQKYGNDHDIRVTVDRESGHVKTFRCMRVVEEISDPNTEVLLEVAIIDYPHIKLDDEIKEELPQLEFGRIAAQNARNIIIEKVRSAERLKQYEEFKNRVGDVINATVKRVEFNNVIVDLGKAEGIIRKDNLIQRESYRVGDRVRALIVDLKLDYKGPLVILSRTHNNFMKSLFMQEVQEVYDGIIEVKAIARDPGSRAKVAVYSADTNIDAVGACVGIKGSRVQAITNELKGEKIDVMLWSASVATFVVNALSPAQILKVVIDEERKKIDVAVNEDQLSLAIGRRGQNVKLASSLTGWKIDILTQEQEAEKRTTENKSKMDLFMNALDVDDMFAQLLISEGFENIEELVATDIAELSQIEGLDEDIATEIRNRSINYLQNLEQKFKEECKALGVNDDINNFGLTYKMQLLLANQDIKNRDDLAELSGEELQEIIPELSIEQANQIIVNARAHWFENQ